MPRKKKIRSCTTKCTRYLRYTKICMFLWMKIRFMVRDRTKILLKPKCCFLGNIWKFPPHPSYLPRSLSISIPWWSTSMKHWSISTKMITFWGIGQDLILFFGLWRYSNFRLFCLVLPPNCMLIPLSKKSNAKSRYLISDCTKNISPFSKAGWSKI